MVRYLIILTQAVLLIEEIDVVSGVHHGVYSGRTHEGVE